MKRKRQVHACSFCAERGHNLTSCSLPGAEKLRRLMQEEKERKKEKSKQTGRRPPRWGQLNTSKGKLKKTQKKEYSGKGASAKAKARRRARRKVNAHKFKGGFDEAMEVLTTAGYFYVPDACVQCGGSIFKEKKERRTSGNVQMLRDILSSQHVGLQLLQDFSCRFGPLSQSYPVTCTNFILSLKLRCSIFF